MSTILSAVMSKEGDTMFSRLIHGCSLGTNIPQNVSNTVTNNIQWVLMLLLPTT